MQVCPTGIDIRKGLQYECIGCAACIDGCNQVMDRMGYPQGLIRYTTENALAQGYDNATMWRRVFRARTLLYMGLLATIVAAVGISLYLREALKVDVIRDRAALARETVPGVIENVYRLQIMNTGETPRQILDRRGRRAGDEGRRRRAADRHCRRDDAPRAGARAGAGRGGQAGCELASSS